MFRRYLLYTLLLLLTLLLAGGIYWFGQEWVAPLAERLWRFYLAVQTLPQEATWTVLLMLAGVNILRLLLGSSPWAETPAPTVHTTGRLSHWAELLRLAGQKGFWGKHLVTEIRKVVARHWALRQHQTMEEALQEIWHGRLPFSPPVRDFLRPNQPVQRPAAVLAAIEEIVTELEIKSER